MLTSNNLFNNWSKDRTPHADNPVFHFHSLPGLIAHIFFSFLNYTHLATPPSTSISYLTSTILSVSLYLFSLLSLNLVCMCCDICGVLLVYPSESKELLFLFLFLSPLLKIPIYCSSPCTDRQTVFLCPSFFLAFF